MTNNPSVILVEDDPRLRELVGGYLLKQNFDVIALADGSELLSKVAVAPPSIIILDVMLPGEDGFSLCRKLRKSYSGPLLFMTAKNETVDQIIGLELGADDYVTKPVEPRVLVARIQALLRRVGTQIKTPRRCFAIWNAQN